MSNLLDELLNHSDEENKSQADIIEKEDEQLAALLTEINFIQDVGIKSFVRSILLRAELFWEIPSDFSDSHPPDESGPGGNVLHTKRVTRIIKLMVDVEGRDEFESDLMLGAALLHDVTKGVKWGDVVGYDPMHPYTVDNFIKSCVQYDEQNNDTITGSSTLYLDDTGISRMLRLIRCHLGFWSPIPETYPISTPDWMLHWADVIATKLHYVVDGDEFDTERWITYEQSEPFEAADSNEDGNTTT